MLGPRGVLQAVKRLMGRMAEPNDCPVVGHWSIFGTDNFSVAGFQHRSSQALALELHTARAREVPCKILIPDRSSS